MSGRPLLHRLAARSLRAAAAHVPVGDVGWSAPSGEVLTLRAEQGGTLPAWLPAAPGEVPHADLRRVWNRATNDPAATFDDSYRSTGFDVGNDPTLGAAYVTIPAGGPWDWDSSAVRHTVWFWAIPPASWRCEVRLSRPLVGDEQLLLWNTGYGLSAVGLRASMGLPARRWIPVGRPSRLPGWIGPIGNRIYVGAFRTFTDDLTVWIRNVANYNGDPPGTPPHEFVDGSAGPVWFSHTSPVRFRDPASNDWRIEEDLPVRPIVGGGLIVPGGGTNLCRPSFSFDGGTWTEGPGMTWSASSGQPLSGLPPPYGFTSPSDQVSWVACTPGIVPTDPLSSVWAHVIVELAGPETGPPGSIHVRDPDGGLSNVYVGPGFAFTVTAGEFEIARVWPAAGPNGGHLFEFLFRTSPGRLGGNHWIVFQPAVVTPLPRTMWVHHVDLRLDDRPDPRALLVTTSAASAASRPPVIADFTAARSGPTLRIALQLDTRDGYRPGTILSLLDDGGGELAAVRAVDAGGGVRLVEVRTPTGTWTSSVELPTGRTVFPLGVDLSPWGATVHGPSSSDVSTAVPVDGSAVAKLRIGCDALGADHAGVPVRTFRMEAERRA